ncbi:MAG: Rrf2 family transcriptional regulator [Calditrichia bacterium]
MLRMSKKVEYGLIALLHMKAKTGRQLSSARELSEQYDIPPELIGKILQRLARAGFLESVQGVKGGYRLAVPLDAVTVQQMVEVLEGPIQLVNCRPGNGGPDCRQHAGCMIRSPMAEIQDRLKTFFENITLKDLQESTAN